MGGEAAMTGSGGTIRPVLSRLYHRMVTKRLQKTGRTP